MCWADELVIAELGQGSKFVGGCCVDHFVMTELVGENLSHLEILI